VAAHLLHAPPPLAARRFMHCRKKKNQGRGGSGMTSSLLPFLVGGDLQTRKNKSKVPVLSPFFRSASPPFFFQICFTAYLSLVYIFISFASGRWRMTKGGWRLGLYRVGVNGWGRARFC
jgi:hypothetical protein